MPGTVEYVWFGEVVLRCSIEFVESDNGTFVSELLKEQTYAAKWGSVSSPTIVLWAPSLTELGVL